MFTETRHARDCSYVVEEGPAPCTCNAGETHFNAVNRTTQIAYNADEVFEEALRKAGFKSRWDWDSTRPSQDPTGAIKFAYLAKVKADEAVHAAWEASRA